MKFSMSLRGYLALQFGVVGIFQLMIIVLLVWLILMPNMRTDIELRHHVLAEAVAGQVAANMLQGEHQINALAGYIGSGPNLSHSQWIDLLDSQCGNGDLFETIYMTKAGSSEIGAVGLARSRRNRRDDLMGLDLSGRNFLHKARRRGTATWSETFLSKASGRMAVAVTVPLADRAVIGEITVDQLSSLIGTFPKKAGMMTLILDSRGRVVADSAGAMSGQYIDEKTLPFGGTGVAVADASGLLELNDRPQIGSVVSIDRLGWKVIVAQLRYNAYQPVREALLTILAGLVLALLLSAVFFRIQAGRMANLFNIYSKRAQAIAGGEYDLEWPKAKTKEIKRLVNSLKQMAAGIKQREARIVESENRLRITLDSIGDAVIATDAQGVVTEMNPTAVQLTGWSSDEACGKPLADVFYIVNGDTRERSPNPVEKVLRKGAIVGLANHTVLIAKDGREYQIADSGAPIRREDGEIEGVVMVFRDVTDSYDQEQKIRESESLLKNLTANAPGVVFKFRVLPDLTYHSAFVSENRMEIFGINAPAEHFFAEFFAGIPNAEKAEFIASIKKAIENGTGFYWEGRYRKPSGETIWFSERVIAQKEGEDAVFYGVFMDITERKQWKNDLEASERRYRDLFNDAPVMYVIGELRNGEPYIRDANNLFVELLGYSRHEVIGTPLSAYYTEESRQFMFADREYTKVMNGEVNAEERTLVTRDGDELYTLLSTLPETDGNGNVSGVRAMFLDITGRKKAEEDAKRMESALMQAQKMEAIGTLAGGIAHDFNNILSGLIGYSELILAQAEDDAKLKRNAEQIFNGAMRARDLVRQILSFSRKEERELRPLQISPLLKEALKLLRSSLPSTIEIRQDISGGLDNVMADPTQIHQVIMNLCTNAAHAMEENGGVLTVSLSQIRLDAKTVQSYPGLVPEKYARLRVEDTGCGIPDDMKERIFNPYFTTKAKGKGTGLGLSVVHGIVKGCGGAIHVASRSGSGTAFDVLLPVVESREIPIEKKQTDLPGGTEHILLVDDEPVLIEVGKAMMEMLGYRVTACSSGAEALDIFQKAPDRIDMVISDMTMPKMTGDVLIENLLTIREDLPVILCTGFSNKISEEKAKQIGIKAVAAKPLVQKELAVLVRRILDEAGELKAGAED